MKVSRAANMNCTTHIATVVTNAAVELGSGWMPAVIPAITDVAIMLSSRTSLKHDVL